MTARLKRSRAGFTLVELIVVIAILAILAGVAIPVYSNYIAKANEAADLQLLGAMNTAFAASCVEMGVEPTEVVGLASLTGEAGSKRVESVTAVGAGAVNLSSGRSFNDVFMTYFGANADLPFKVYTSLGYDMANGVFVDGAKELTFATVGGTVTVTAAQLGAYRGSSFDEMGAAGITSKIDALVDQAMGAITESDVAFLSSDEFTSFLTEKGITLDPSDPNYAKKAANALVLYTASHAEVTDVQSWLSALRNGDPLVIQGQTSADIILPLAAEYAMLTAFCSDPDAKISTTTYHEGENIVETSGDVFNAYYAYASQSGTFDKEKAKEWLRNQYGPDVTITSAKKNGFNITTQGGEATTELNAAEWFAEQTANMQNNGGVFSITGLHLYAPPTYDSQGNMIKDAVYTDYTGMWETFSQSNEYQQYIQDQAGSDLNAFLNALQMVDANTSNVDINNVLTNGWQYGGIADIIAAVTGNP